MYNRQLDAFVKAAEWKSFSKAAQELFIAPTSLIQQINTLEKSIGITLFSRTPRGVSLTPAGESLYKDACQIISLSQTAIKRARQLQDGLDREISVGQSPYRGTSYLLQMIVEFQKEHPDFSVKLCQARSPVEEWSQPLAGLGKEFSFYEAVYMTGVHRDTCDFIKLLDTPLVIGIPAKHPLHVQKTIPLECLAGEKIVMFRQGLSTHADALRKHLAQGVEATIVDADFFDRHDLFAMEKNRMLMIRPAAWGNAYPVLEPHPLEPVFTIPYGIFCADGLSDDILLFRNWLEDRAARFSHVTG